MPKFRVLRSERFAVKYTVELDDEDGIYAGDFEWPEPDEEPLMVGDDIVEMDLIEEEED